MPCAGGVQAVMGAVLNAPLWAGQFEKSGRVCFLWWEAGDESNRFHFLPPAFKFADAVQTGQLRDVRKSDLFRRDFPELQTAPLDPAVALLHLEELRGKNLPGGSVALVVEGSADCL